jgi:hypothetical protein
VTAELLPVLGLTALLAGIGFLMVVVGVQKYMLEWKPRVCPRCGSSSDRGCRCRVR